MDIASYVGAVSRVLETRDHEGEPAFVVVATRLYDTTPEDLWDAITNPERLPRWFTTVEGDFRLNGRYSVKHNASGTITACEPPQTLSLTWEFGPAVSWVNVVLAPEGEGVRLTLEHVQRDSPHWTKFGAGATGVGWDLALLGLALHVESRGEAAHPEDSGWSATDEGKEFARLAGEDWAKAERAGGASAEDAEIRGRRTIAFYRGEPVPE
jgi:uncharacterized protein YndB with AHSA1/START domain